jgi:hypothetical protein
MGVTAYVAEPGHRMGPAADRLYAVDPGAVAAIKPSPCRE